MKKILLLLGVMLMIQWALQDVDQVVDNLAGSYNYQTSIFGLFTERNCYYTNINRLRKKASKEQLLELLNHENGKVVAAAAEALIEREEVDPFWLFQEFSSDQRIYQTSFTCLLSTSTLPHTIYHSFRNKERGDQPYSDLHYSSAFDEIPVMGNKDSPILKSMDSLILFRKSIDQVLLSAVLRNRIYEGEHLKRIKELAYQESQVPAIEYLFVHHIEEEEAALKLHLEAFQEDENLEYYEEGSIVRMLSKWKNPKTISIDSILLLSYEGGNSLPPPPPPGLDDEINAAYKNPEKYYQSFYPQYDPARDMALPPMTPMLTDLNNKYHPSIQWESKKVLTGEALKKFRALLTCDQESTHDFPPADCFSPRHGVIFYAKGKITAVYSICLECNRVRKKNLIKLRNFPASVEEYNTEVDCINFAALTKSLSDHGF